jgi:hypothetical protein
MITMCWIGVAHPSPEEPANADGVVDPTIVVKATNTAIVFLKAEIINSCNMKFVLRGPRHAFDRMRFASVRFAKSMGNGAALGLSGRPA